MGRHRILIISSGNPCRNPRPVKEASALVQAGFDVTLLTAGRPDLKLADENALAGISCHHVFLPDASDFLSRAQRWLACRATRIGLESPRALGASAPLMRAARQINADLTIVHNEVPHAVGVALLKEGRRVAADFEDWHSEDLLPSDRQSRPLRLLRTQEHFLLNNAAYCTTTSHALAKAFQEAYGCPSPQVLTNSFPLQPLPKREENAEPRILWFSQTIGPGRGLETFLSAWRNTKHPSRLTLLGDVSEDYRAQLCQSLPPEFASRIQFAPLVMPSALPELLARHDIGLALEDRSIRNRDLTITNKILQYLNAGLAVFATATEGQREVLQTSSEAGVLVGPSEPAQYVDRLEALLSSPEKLSGMRRAARHLAETHYCWEKEAPILVAKVQDALKTN
jgi:glycosyltransferase involved in cell wall biosynthesis